MMTLENTEEQNLDPRVKVLWWIVAIVPAVIFTAITSAIAFAASTGFGIGVLTFYTLIIICLVIYISLRWKNWTYQVGKESLVLRHGVVWKRSLVIPYFRVQQIDVVRNPVARMIGLSYVLVSTASRQRDPVIPGLSAEDAEALRLKLLHQAGSTDAV